MSWPATSGVSARVVRDFRLATRGGQFRVALALSLIVHLAALFVLGRGGMGLKAARDFSQMHVRLVAAEPLPDPVPAAPPITAPADTPRRKHSGELAALVPVSPAAAVPSAPVAPLPPDLLEPVPSEVFVGAALSEAVERSWPPEAGAPGLPQPQVQPDGAADSTAPPIVAVAAPVAPTAAAGQPGDGPTVALLASAAGNGSGGSPAAGLAGEGFKTAGAAAAPAGAADAVAAATGARLEPGPRDLAAVQRRIDARKVYPQIAVRNGWQGRVLVEMHLDGDGSLADVRLLEGSGHPVLDTATITAVRRASPFPPIARVLHVPVEYRLVP